MENNSDNINYIFNSYTINVAKRELQLDNSEVKVQARVFDLLIFLLENRDRIVDKNELFDAVWPDVVITDAAMARAIMKARKAVGDDANQQSVIKTLHGQGYRFVADIETIRVPEKPVGEINQNSEHEPDDKPVHLETKVPSGKFSKLVLQLVIVSLGMLTYIVYLHFKEPDNPQVESQYPSNSIAVLSFVNMSDDPENEYFSDGISEELLHLLTKIPKLRVVSSSSSFSFKGKDFDIPTIASLLKVAYVLNGSVRKSGNTIRVAVQLIDPNTDSHIWSEVYDRTLDDIFTIQDEIAQAVVDELKVTLLGDVPKVKKTNPEAYTLFLHARHLGTRFTPEAFEMSNKLYKQVLEIDSNYAAAWSGLAANYINQTISGQRQDNGLSLAREAAHQSLLIDPDQASGYAHLSRVALRFDRNLKTSAKYLERALSLEPTNLDILRHAATLSRSLGRLSEAIALNKYVIERDPINPVNHYFLGFSYLLVGHLDEAIASFRTTLMLSSNHVSAHYRIGTAMYYKGEPAAALEEMQLEKGVTKHLMGSVMIQHALKNNRASDIALAELINKYEQTAAYNIAYLLAFRGETDRAFEWLEKALLYKDSGLVQIAYQLEFENIHNDPRWLTFLENIGMSFEQLNDIDFKVTVPK